MLKLVWTGPDGGDEVSIPLRGSDEERLRRKLGGGDWASDEALKILAEVLAGPAARFARRRTVPPSQHAIDCAARVIACHQVVIPEAAIRDRDAMAQFLRSHPVGDAECSPGLILYGHPAVRVLPQPPRVMRALQRAGHLKRPAGATAAKPPVRWARHEPRTDTTDNQNINRKRK